MSDTGRLAGFAALLATALAVGLGLGAAVGPLGGTAPAEPTHQSGMEDRS